MDVLADHTDIVNSKSEAKRAIQGNAIAINKEKTTDVDAELSAGDLLHDRYVLIENGKKNRYLLTLS
jgi:tyrosyl-tRNA synthetase